MLIRTYRISFLTLIFITFIFLTGSINGVNVKLPLAFISFISFYLIAFKENLKIKKDNLVLMILFLVLCIIETFNGIMHGFPANFAIRELIGFISPLIILGLYNRDLINLGSVKKTMIFGALVYSIGKIICAALISNQILDFLVFKTFIKNTFDYDVVSMLIYQKFNIVRIYLVNDLLISFIPIVLFKGNIIKSKFAKTFIYITFCLSMFLCYSRFLIVVFLVTSILPFVTLKKFRITPRRLISSFFIICFLLIYFLLNGLPKIITERFSLTNANNQFSDGIRNDQFHAILDMINNHLFIGSGLGSYNPNFIRADYVYELQWLSIIFKLGLPVFLFLCALIIIYFYKNFSIGFKSITFFSLIMISSVFNPYLESTTMGACILIIYTVYHIKLDPLINNES